MRFIVDLAERYLQPKRLIRGSLTLLAIGLIVAIEIFDPEYLLSARFVLYAAVFLLLALIIRLPQLQD